MILDKDRRRFTRYKHSSDFHLSIGGAAVQARTIDFSIGGLGFSVGGFGFSVGLF